MNNTCSTTNSSLDDLLVSILLAYDLHLRIKHHGTKPVVRIILWIIWLLIDANTRNVLHQILIQSLNVLMVSNVLIEYRHLTTTNTRAYIWHTIVETDSCMLIVRICITGLSSVPHDCVCILSITTNQSTTTWSSNHLVTIEWEYTKLTESTKDLTVETRSHTLSSIFDNRNIILICNLHNAINLIWHTIERYWDDCLWIFTRLLLAIENSLLK